MNLYETTFIINPQTDDATIDQRVRDVAELIAKNEGRIVYEDHMGTRRLAYEIMGLTQGYYASFIFEGSRAILPPLQRHFKLNEAYIRHLTVRFEAGADVLGRLQAATAPEAEQSAAAPSHRPRPATRRPEEPPKEAEPVDTERPEEPSKEAEPVAADEGKTEMPEAGDDASKKDTESDSETREDSEL